jgi:hypothetical protein
VIERSDDLKSVGGSYAFKRCFFKCINDIMYMFKKNKVRVDAERKKSVYVMCLAMCYDEYKK